MMNRKANKLYQTEFVMFVVNSAWETIARSYEIVKGRVNQLTEILNFIIKKHALLQQ